VLFGVGSYFRGQDMGAPVRLSNAFDPICSKAETGFGALRINRRFEFPVSYPWVRGRFGGELTKQINEQPKKEKGTSDETVFYCGALTKKGTPCTRRV
jgi:hypothetical protein